MEKTPSLWDGDLSVYEPNADPGSTVYINALVLIWMRPSHPDHWSIEKNARGDGYDFEGEDGVPSPNENGGKGQTVEGLPAVLHPTYDLDAIHEQMMATVPVRSS